MIKTKGVAHFTIPVTDTERSAEFYSKVLGMRVLSEDPGRGMAFLDCGGDCVVLARTMQPIPTAGGRDFHHSFKVDHADFPAAVAELKASGAKFLYEEERNKGTLRGSLAYFEDPDGNVLEIIDLQYYAGAASQA